MDFNPRPREGSDNRLESMLKEAQISIHAPVKGATEVWGCFFLYPSDFNPRPREGSDFRLFLEPFKQ